MPEWDTSVERNGEVRRSRSASPIPSAASPAYGCGSTPACPATGSNSPTVTRNGSSPCPRRRRGGWSTSSSCATADGGVETVSDPANPRAGRRRVRRQVGAGCARLPRAGLARPARTARRAPGASCTVPAPALGAEINVRLWSPTTRHRPSAWSSPTTGRSTTSCADLGHYSAAMVGAGRVAPFHLALLAPGDRNDWYSANPAYARALASARAAPRCAAELGSAPAGRSAMGASLGALAMLHAQRRFPGAFAGLFLQSGSFFRPRLDRAGVRLPVLPPDRPVRRAGGRVRVRRAPRSRGAHLRDGRGEPRTTTARWRTPCAARAIRSTLAEVPDAHNFTAWRDAFDPHLTDLLRRVCEGCGRYA